MAFKLDKVNQMNECKPIVMKELANVTKQKTQAIVADTLAMFVFFS